MIAAELQVAEAFAHFRRGDLAAAEGLLVALPEQPSALHLMGVLRVRQGRVPEAATLLARAVALQPQEAQAQFNYGKVLAALGRTPDAEAALRAALARDAAHADAALALARLLHAAERFDEAATAWRTRLALCPGDGAAGLGLGDALIRAGRPAEAKPVLETALAISRDARLSADLHQALAMACRTDPGAALMHLETAQTLDPARTALDGDRAALLQEQQRFADARALYEAMLARDPANPALHEAYNDLLHRMGADDAFLSSYDAAPRSPALLLQKARLLLAAERGAEAESLFGALLKSEPHHPEAALGHGLALLQQGAVAEAVGALEKAAAARPEAADIWCNLAGALARNGDGEKAQAMAARSLSLEPCNQMALAILGTSWRLMGDAREEWLNRPDEFIQVYDLEPPDGFADMEQFNAALNVSLDRLHPPLREYLRQSLRGGTQTSANLFGSGRILVETLRRRIEEAVTRYLAGLQHTHDHPFLSRKSAGFGFAGSWSSRLRDRGFHINHVHPGGWISSCYYVDLPPVVRDGEGEQGWLKFGEPSFETGLGPRRTIQPRPGCLVLFPSYMWHGTNPFRDRHCRTTIAFDLVPA